MRKKIEAATKRDHAERAKQRKRDEAQRRAYIAELEREIEEEDEAAKDSVAPDPDTAWRQTIEDRISLQGGGFPAHYPRLPPGWGIRQEDKRKIRAERAAEARNKREQKAGLPAKQAKHDAAVQKINAAKTAEIREGEKAGREIEKAARETAEKTAESKLKALGPRPALSE